MVVDDAARPTGVRREAIEVRLESTHVEDRVDAKRRRKVELVRVGVHDTLDLERTEVLERELRCATVSPP